MSDRGFIYALCDPETREVRYVGQTVHRPEARMLGHLASARYSRTLKAARWIRSLPCEPLVRVLERDVPRADLAAREREWIRTMKRRGAKLVNTAEVARA